MVGNGLEWLFSADQGHALVGAGLLRIVLIGASPKASENPVAFRVDQLPPGRAGLCASRDSVDNAETGAQVERRHCGDDENLTGCLGSCTCALSKAQVVLWLGKCRPRPQLSPLAKIFIFLNKIFTPENTAARQKLRNKRSNCSSILCTVEANSAV